MQVDNGTTTTTTQVADCAGLTEEVWRRIGRQLRLTSRELQVMRCVVSEQTDDQIALTLGIAPRTVRTHLEHLFAKCGCHSRAGAVACAFGAYVRICAAA